MEELNKQIAEKTRKITQEQIGNLVMVNLELSTTKQVLLDKINILNNEIEQLKKKIDAQEEICA